MPRTRLLLTTGDQIDVEGTPEDVVKELENAARSSLGTLAWLTESASEELVGVNAAQVVTVRRMEA
jgi:hypothetical protein